MAGDRIAVQLDKQRWLRYDLNALANIEKLTGVPIGKEIAVTATTLRVILWAGLLHEDATLTLDQVGAMVVGGNYPDVAAAVAEGLEAAFGAPAPTTDPLVSAGTGTS